MYYYELVYPGINGLEIAWRIRLLGNLPRVFGSTPRSNLDTLLLVAMGRAEGILVQIFDLDESDIHPIIVKTDVFYGDRAEERIRTFISQPGYILREYNPLA